MRSKSPKSSWVKPIRSRWVVAALALLAGFAGVPAFAVSVVPYGVANTFVDSGTGTADTIYYLDRSYLVPTPHPINPTYRTFDFNGGEDFQYVVSGASGDATKQYLWAFVAPASGTTYIRSKIAYCNAGTVDANGACPFGVTDSFLVNLDFASICSSGGALVRGCSGTAVNLTAPIIGFSVQFVVGTASPPTGITASNAIQVIPEIAGPSVTVPGGDGFFPGDGAILVDTSAVTATQNATSGGSPAFPYVYVVAQRGGIPADPLASEVVQVAPYATGQQKVNGFENSTADGGIVAYDMQLGVMDSAGAVTFGGTTYQNVFATDIQGFLRESNCFVATASYRNGRAPGVMLLRHFRDEVLERYDLGRDFIGWYYANGPIAADWLIAHPIYRPAALLLLMPLQAFAWVTLHPGALLAPFFALFGILFAFGFRFRKGRSLVAVFISAALLGAASSDARATEQPYIDSLISELPKEPEPTVDRPEPYIDSVRKKMSKNADDDPTGYTEELRKEIPKSDGSEGYAERIQRKLPRENGSAIEDYRKGKQLKANKGSLDTRSAFGFDILAGATRTYTSGENTQIAYETVYGDGWVPELSLHYEWRPFTSSFLKKFGLFTSLGASFTKAKGVFDYQDTRFGAESETEFRFIAIPANVGLIYRFSLFDFMWPYFGGGPSVIGFTETRNDKQPGNHGYDLGYWFMGGVAFGLDWISPKSSWDQYESTGVKHSYFTIDYSYLESVSGGLVEFTVDGVRLGFTFEL